MAKKKKTAEDLAKDQNIVTEEQLKELKGPYMAKDQEEWKKMRQAQIDLKNSDTYKQKSFFVPNEAVVNIPVSGMFKTSIQETLNFVLSRMSKEEVIRTMLNIQTNFSNIDKEQLTKGDMAAWSLMSLLAEFNFQAQEQGKLVHTDETIGDQMTDFIEKMESDPAFEVTHEEIEKITKDYKSIVPGAASFKFADEEEKEKKKEEKSDTNED